MRCFAFKTQMMGLWLCCASLPFAASPVVAQSAPPPGKLFIQVLEGEGALNDVRSRTTREPVVQVEDENHKPIAGALVIFTTPSTGASGTFANGATMLRTVSNAEGKAIATDFKPNGIPGSYQIQVQASWHHMESSSVINQANTKSGASSTEAVHAARAFPLKVVLIIGAVAAAGAVAGVLATRGSSAPTISAGTPTVGPPAATVRLPLPGTRK